MGHLLHAEAAGSAAPRSDEGRSSGTAQGPGDSKCVATLVARAALAGYELVELADGSFIASRWGMFRSLDHMAAVEQFLRRVGAPA